MGEVIRMPVPVNRSATRGSDNAMLRDASPSTAAEQEAQREERRQRCRVLIAKLEKNPVLSRDDQLEIATGVWRVLERVELQGRAKKAQIMRAAGIGAPGDSTKHLGQYAVNPAWPESRLRNVRLNKKPIPYLKLVQKAAELAGWNQDDTVLEVFSTISIAMLRRPRLADAAFEDLAKTLRDIGGAIAAKHDLQAYFKLLSRTGPTFGLSSEHDSAVRS
jgi:hypothetical protein